MKLGVLLFVSLSFSAPASADPCADRMGQVQTEVKGLALEQRTHVTKDFDAFYLMKPGTAERVMVSCGPNVLSIDADWEKGTPPPAYRDLIRSVGRALGFGDDDLNAALEKCLNEAGADNEEEDGQEGVETARAQLTCGNNTGRTEITISKLR
jgi:hypothetical protein